MEDLARKCHVSVSNPQKLFKYVFGLSVGEYLLKRRLSVATRELVNTNKSITDIALNYRYASPEAFSRAFRNFWGVLPSEFRKKHRFSELFPKLELDHEKLKNENGGNIVSTHRRVDITELYDELKKLCDTYVLCVDICNLKPINNTYGYAAGDLAIAEGARRIDSALSRNMLMFRIGRDEFVVVTGYRSITDAETLANKITALNGNCVKYGDKEIPLSLRIGICKIPNGDLCYHETLDKMHNIIDRVKQENVFIGILDG